MRGTRAVARIHLARPNPVWRAIDENRRIVLVITGDWVFVPGAWKKLAELDEDPSYGVPTTYCTSVQLMCDASIMDAEADKADILRQQIARLDPDGGLVDPIAHGRTLRGIRGLHLDIQEIRAKFKYGGNADGRHRHHVAERLAGSETPGAAAALTHLLRRPGIDGLLNGEAGG
ncbi:MAG: FMN-binding negative transcriptional regulator [Pseudonocardiaceae bacterium]